MLQHPDVTVGSLVEAFPTELCDLRGCPALVRRLDIEGHYSAMVAKQEMEVTDLRRSEGLQLPQDIPYNRYAGSVVQWWHLSRGSVVYQSG